MHTALIKTEMNCIYLVHKKQWNATTKARDQVKLFED